MTASLVSSAGTDNGGSTSIPLNMPASIVAARLLVAHVYDAQVPSISGWTQIYTATNSWTLRGFAKVAAGGDTATVTTAVSGAMVARVDQYTDWSGVIADIVAATSTTADPPLCDPGLSKDWRWIAIQGIVLTSSGLITDAPANYSNFARTSRGTTTIAQIATSDRALTGSSENPGAYTFSGGTQANPVAATVAIPPAADASASPPTQPIVAPSVAAHHASTW